MKQITGGITAAKGFQASGTYCGIKKAMAPDSNEGEIGKEKNDIALVVADTLCNTAAVYTQNKVKGAPILVMKKHLAATGGKARALIANSKNANTCNADGEEKAEAMCKLTADALGIAPEEVMVMSTGVIGQILPLEPIEKAIPVLCEKLSPNGNLEAATAIMTTDTVSKEVAVSFTLDGKTCHLGGMAKGSGMIHPNMATTLNCITTDAAISAELLQTALSDVVKVTYNCLYGDGVRSGWQCRNYRTECRLCRFPAGIVYCHDEPDSKACKGWRRGFQAVGMHGIRCKGFGYCYHHCKERDLFAAV